MTYFTYIVLLLPELNYCEKNPDTCKNGGKCQSLEARDGNYRCSCPSGISGRNCENLPDSMTVPPANSTETPEVAEVPDVPEVSSSQTPEDVTVSTKEPNSGDNETE